MITAESMWRTSRVAGAAVAATLSRVRRALPEILDAGAIVLGWTLVTWGVALLTAWPTWPISAGLFLLSWAGWKHIGTIFWHGLYALSRDERAARRGR